MADNEITTISGLLEHQVVITSYPGFWLYQDCDIITVCYSAFDLFKDRTLTNIDY